MKALSINNLKKTYKGGLDALKGIDLDVEEGDFFALLGPNGAGKSTAINVISSLVTKSSGKVEILGIDIDQNHSLAKKELGVVGQEVNFNQFEKVSNIVINQAGYFGLSRKKAKENGEYFLKRLDLWDKRNEVGRNLSGGMKRRVMVAKALVNKPKLLILDEPTAGVDIELRRSLWDFLQEINEQGTTIILTTHYLEEAERLCRNIAIIDEGEIVENTTMVKLLGKLEVESFVLDIDKSLSKRELIENKYQIKLLNDKQLSVTLEKGQKLNDVFSYLSENQISVLSMRNETGRLEELFVNLLEESK
ncbi:MAG: ABC transporter ATP-binding protein [Pseudomonadota bacterium]|nr:ABC transporter ATP-binding protein [Pseudomonadota bacterium]